MYQRLLLAQSQFCAPSLKFCALPPKNTPAAPPQTHSMRSKLPSRWRLLRPLIHNCVFSLGPIPPLYPFLSILTNFDVEAGGSTHTEERGQ